MKRQLPGETRYLLGLREYFRADCIDYLTPDWPPRRGGAVGVGVPNVPALGVSNTGDRPALVFSARPGSVEFPLVPGLPLGGYPAILTAGAQAADGFNVWGCLSGAAGTVGVGAVYSRGGGQLWHRWDFLGGAGTVDVPIGTIGLDPFAAFSALMTSGVFGGVYQGGFWTVAFTAAPNAGAVAGSDTLRVGSDAPFNVRSMLGYVHEVLIARSDDDFGLVDKAQALAAKWAIP